MSVAEHVGKLTEREYLDVERAADFKSEFFDGEMFAMAGGTPMHSLIATNLAVEFSNQLRGQPCVPFNSDLRMKVEATGLFTYPDLSVVCGELQFANDSDDTIVNPTVLAEVLSNSTEAYDRGKKFEHYQKIPTLKEYLLVSQREPHIELFLRQSNGDWLLRQSAGLDAGLVIPSLNITVSLARVFANVKFVPAPIRPQTPRPI
ncbi:MAG TPA: Uma2 family endonuclease [Verrucomicrobiae bacterium]|nr:Uma2 family endonuclease [Verrucomicrobiae bacterium]